jgi:hypothetical protein
LEGRLIVRTRLESHAAKMLARLLGLLGQRVALQQALLLERRAAVGAEGDLWPSILAADTMVSPLVISVPGIEVQPANINVAAPSAAAARARGRVRRSWDLLA